MKKQTYTLILLILFGYIFGIYLILAGYGESMYLPFLVIGNIIIPFLTVLINYELKKVGYFFIFLFAILPPIALYFTDFQKVASDCSDGEIFLCNLEPFLLAYIYFILTIFAFVYSHTQQRESEKEIERNQREIKRLKKEIEIREHKLYSFKKD